MGLGQQLAQFGGDFHRMTGVSSPGKNECRNINRTNNLFGRQVGQCRPCVQNRQGPSIHGLQPFHGASDLFLGRPCKPVWKVFSKTPGGQFCKQLSTQKCACFRHLSIGVRHGFSLFPGGWRRYQYKPFDSMGDFQCRVYRRSASHGLTASHISINVQEIGYGRHIVCERSPMIGSGNIR